MRTGTPLLNDDGTASMATFFLSSHHGLNRDVAYLERALSKVRGGDRSAVEALAAYWKQFHETLHGHHTVEDANIFPGLAPGAPEVFATLGAQHRQLDPLLAKGDAAFAAGIPDVDAALTVVREVRVLLDEHLTLEEAHVIPTIRGANEFPPPATPEMADMYASGFAWSLYGLSPNVVEQVLERLPSILTERLPAAREAFAKRFQATFGAEAPASSTTSVPAPLA